MRSTCCKHELFTATKQFYCTQLLMKYVVAKATASNEKKNTKTNTEVNDTSISHHLLYISSIFTLLSFVLYIYHTYRYYIRGTLVHIYKTHYRYGGYMYLVYL